MSTVVNMRGEPMPKAPGLRALRAPVLLLAVEAMSRRVIELPGTICGRSYAAEPTYMVKTGVGVFHEVREENLA